MGTARRMAALIVAPFLVAVAVPASAIGPLRALHAPAQRVVSFEPPAGWERSASPPSSRLLGTWSHHDGGRLTLAAERTTVKSAQQVFEQSRPSLEKQGWTLGRVDHKPERVVVEATLDKGRRMARQLYLVEEGFAYVVTLVGPVEQQAERSHDFDEAVASLKLGAGEDERK
jgi:hypothetical protein